MACPVCDHTMKTIFVDQVIKRYWCSRCGTLKDEITHKDTVIIEIPTLVRRCRQFEPTLPRNTFGEVWIQMGVAESIHPPESRMK